MNADELREMYLAFFADKGHKIISGSSLIPENDPTVLFTTAGMHPLAPYLLGEPHPAGKRLCNCQKCIRTGDIESVGDASHLTFFEMLGNWSLGDYFKQEAIEWSYGFLTSSQWLGLDPAALSVSVFEGNETAPRDEESIQAWLKLGIPKERIFALPETDNWWGLPGESGPCGPDTEMFIDTGRPACGAGCRPGCSCGKFFEVWNDVFMQYEKMPGGAVRPLKQHNVDTGMGVERTVAMLQGKASVFDTEVFHPLIGALEEAASRRMSESDDIAKAFRVICDHLRSAVFILGDDRGVLPGNLGQGYVLRRLIRRAVRYAKKIGLAVGFTRVISEAVVGGYSGFYPELGRSRDRIVGELVGEEERFEGTLEKGLVELNRLLGRMREHGEKTVSGRMAFKLYDTYGFPVEFTEEICAEDGMTVDHEGYEKAFEGHKALSKKGAGKAFKGGLADRSDATVALHTATHLLHRSLQIVLGEHVQQKGSNITPERLRFDFLHPSKLTDTEKTEVERLVNDAIQRDLPIQREAMTLEEARKRGATALFEGKYGEEVSVYSVGDFSKEACGGPHVERTGLLGTFRITKETASSAGVRRIKAVLE
jgi:alanyl-tRNA synthetase